MSNLNNHTQQTWQLSTNLLGRGGSGNLMALSLQGLKLGWHPEMSIGLGQPRGQEWGPSKKVKGQGLLAGSIRRACNS